MSNLITSEARFIGRGNVLVLAAPTHQTVRVLGGVIWATYGRGRDIIAAAGDALALQRAGRVVISGLRGPAWIEVIARDARVAV
jgi:hypothetical protein